MKIAICISGHLRDGDKLCFPSLKKYLLDKYDCDIFISAFKEMGNVQYVHLDNHPSEPDTDVTEKILSTYKPVRYRMDSSNALWINDLKKQWGDLSTRNTARAFQVAAMHRNIYDAQLLRRMYQADTGKKYDVVIRTRFDNELLSDIINDSNYTGGDYGLIFKQGHCGIFDQTFWGGSQSMDAATECYLYMSDIVNASNVKTFENAENIFTAYLHAREIPYTVRDDIKLSITKPHGRHVT